MPFTLVVILIVFVAAMVWLVNWEPDKDKDAKKKKDKGKADDKTLLDDIEKVFSDLKNDAKTFDRKEFIPTLDEARTKVLKVLTTRELDLNKTAAKS